MSGGLIALLDDVAAIAKVAAASLDDVAAQAVKTASASLDDVAAQAAKAGAKAAGVVIDDAAVTPRYVVGFAADRELPIVWKIALGSLKNKLMILLPGALLLSAVAPWAITPLLMAGGLFLCFEGYEKLHALVSGHDAHQTEAGEASSPEALEAAKITGAIRTDMILSGEIMAITLAQVADQSFAMKAVVLAGVGLGITALVYGAVALIVKADDAGLHLARKGRLATTRALGRAMVKGVPPLLAALSLIGTAAMLWVGGGILLHGAAGYGLAGPEHLMEALGAMVAGVVPLLKGLAGWLAGAVFAGVVGVVAGALVALGLAGIKAVMPGPATH